MEKKTNNNSFFSLVLKGIFFIAIVAGTILVINYFTNDNTKNKIDELLGLDPNATTEQKKELDKSSNTIAIPGFEKLVFQANKLTQNVSFHNPEENEVFFIVNFFIDDKSVYQSELIEPGKGIYSINLPMSYNVGQYSGKLIYETRSIGNSNEKKNGATIHLPIIFE